MSAPTAPAKKAKAQRAKAQRAKAQRAKAKSAEEQLEERFARGELSEAQFEAEMGELLEAESKAEDLDAAVTPDGHDSEEPEEPAHEALLEISTLAPERSTVLIDDKEYELHAMGEWGIVEQHRVKRETEEYDALWKREALNSKQGARLEFLLHSICDKVLVAPKAIKTSLRDEARQQVVLVFTLAPLVRAAEREMKEQEARDGSTSET